MTAEYKAITYKSGEKKLDIESKFNDATYHSLADVYLIEGMEFEYVGRVVEFEYFAGTRLILHSKEGELISTGATEIETVEQGIEELKKHKNSLIETDNRFRKEYLEHKETCEEYGIREDSYVRWANARMYIEHIEEIKFRIGHYEKELKKYAEFLDTEMAKEIPVHINELVTGKVEEIADAIIKLKSDLEKYIEYLKDYK